MFKIVLLALITSLGLRFETGHAAYYAKGRMMEVVRVRQAGWTAGDLPVELPPCIGFVATCGEIGSQVWLYHASEGLRGPYLVADCCNQMEGHCARMHKRGIVAEVDWNTARRWQVLRVGPQYIHVAIVRLDD